MTATKQLNSVIISEIQYSMTHLYHYHIYFSSLQYSCQNDKLHQVLEDIYILLKFFQTKPKRKATCTTFQKTSERGSKKGWHTIKIWYFCRNVVRLWARSYGQKLSRLRRKHFDRSINFVLFIWVNVFLLVR